MRLTIDLDEDMEPLDTKDYCRVLKEDVDLFVNEQPWYVKAIRVDYDADGNVFAWGPYGEEVAALVVLARTQAPQVLLDKQGGKWLLCLSPCEKED